MNTKKGGVVKQSGNDAVGYRPQKVLFQPNVRVILQDTVSCAVVLVDATTHPQHTHAANKTCLASHVSFLFLFEVSKQKYFQLRALNLDPTKLEKLDADDDRHFSASGSDLARERQ